MSTLAWIVLSGILMSALALVGSVTLILPERTFKTLVLPMVSLAAGSLLGERCSTCSPKRSTRSAGILVHSGWDRRSALTFNVVSAATFLVGSLVAYGLAERVQVAFLVPFAAGNFVYIALRICCPSSAPHASRETS